MNTSRNLLVLFAFLFLATFISYGQQGINYKALIKDSGGNIVANQNITIQFSILEGPVGNTLVYQETLHPNTDSNGIVSTIIGEGTVDFGNFLTIDWGSDAHYLNVKIDTGSGLTDMGSAQFYDVPYAMHAYKLNSEAIGIEDLSDGKTDATGYSVFLGMDAGLNDDGTFNYNTGVGYQVLKSNITGEGNTASGYKALTANTTGSYNTAFGMNAMRDTEIGGGNTAMGFGALVLNISGSFNSAIGSQSLVYNDSGSHNTAIGYSALYFNNSGENNTAIGGQALYNNTIGGFNSANGVKALYSNTSGSENAATGYQALYSNTTGYQNVANGTSALYFNTTGAFNTAVGQSTLNRNTSGNYNTAIGERSLYFNTFGVYNTAGGAQALYNNTSGFNNTASGYQSLYSNTTGNFNSAFGYGALHDNNTGSSNTAIGNGALSISTGNTNTALGTGTLSDLTSGSNNLGIGYNAEVPNATGSNQVQIGNANITSLYCMGAYVGTVGGTNRDLYVDNTGKIGYVASSARYKENIVAMENTDWIFKLRPVNYTYKNDVSNQKQYGLIAEEVEKVNPALISYNEAGEVETVNYSKLIAPLLKVIQEQHQIIENQKNEIELQKNKINSITLNLRNTQESQKDILSRLQYLETALNNTEQ